MTDFAAGKLDRRISILRSSQTLNALNEPVLTWALLASVAASKKDVSDGERLRAQELNATVTTRFRIRWSSKVSDVDPRDRIEFDGRLYDIAAVKEIDRKVGIEITAAARAERV